MSETEAYAAMGRQPKQRISSRLNEHKSFDLTPLNAIATPKQLATARVPRNLTRGNHHGADGKAISTSRALRKGLHGICKWCFKEVSFEAGCWDHQQKKEQLLSERPDNWAAIYRFHQTRGVLNPIVEIRWAAMDEINEQKAPKQREIKEVGNKGDRAEESPEITEAAAALDNKEASATKADFSKGFGKDWGSVEDRLTSMRASKQIIEVTTEDWNRMQASSSLIPTDSKARILLGQSRRLGIVQTAIPRNHFVQTRMKYDLDPIYHTSTAPTRRYKATAQVPAAEADALNGSGARHPPAILKSTAGGLGSAKRDIRTVGCGLNGSHVKESPGNAPGGGGTGRVQNKPKLMGYRG